MKRKHTLIAFAALCCFSLPVMGEEMHVSTKAPDTTKKMDEQQAAIEARRAAREKEQDEFFRGLLKKHGGEGTPTEQAERAVLGGWKEGAQE
jgi:hypothetical protein